MCQNVNNIHLCHTVQQRPLVKHQLLYCVCVSDPACCVFPIYLCCMCFSTLYACVCMYVCEFVPVCLRHLCTYACLLCVHLYVQIAFNHHHHIQQALNLSQCDATGTITCMQEPCNIPHTTTTATCNYHHHMYTTITNTSTYHHHTQPRAPPPHTTTTTTYKHHHHTQPPLPRTTMCTTTYNHVHHHIQPPPPHNASNNRTTMSGSRVNTLARSGKRPPAQVTDGQDHMCMYSDCASCYRGSGPHVQVEYCASCSYVAR